MDNLHNRPVGLDQVLNRPEMYLTLDERKALLEDPSGHPDGLGGWHHPFKDRFCAMCRTVRQEERTDGYQNEGPESP